MNIQRDLREARPIPRKPERARGRIWKGLVWVLLGVAVVGGIVWWTQTRQAPETRPGRFATAGPMPVGVAAATKEDITITLSALGTVTPFASVLVKTQIAGQLVRIAFEEGQAVEKGDLLAEIDPRPYQHVLEQAQGQLARDVALLRNAEVDLARYRTLAAQNSIARQQLDTQLALVRQYEATVRTDQALVDAAKLNLAYCRITAPVSGRVGLRQVDAGNYVQTNDANGIVVLNQIRPITVLFSLPEDNLPTIVKRLRSGAALPVTAYDRGRRSALATGWLLTIDNQVDTATGTVKLKAQFENEDESLFPNQFVNVELVVDVLAGQTVIPTAAVQRGAPGTFVYVVKPDSTAAVQAIQLGPTDGDRVAVQSGLQPGDRVVTDGADRLRDGAKVLLPGAVPSQRGAAAPGDGRRRE